MNPRRTAALRVGELVRYGSAVYRVGLVNSCRARLDIVRGTPVARAFTDSRRGEAVEFNSWSEARHPNVSPTSLLPRVTA